MKGITADMLRDIVNRDIDRAKHGPRRPENQRKYTRIVHIDVETVRTLKQLKKANKIKSLSKTIDLLVATVALTEYNKKGE